MRLVGKYSASTYGFRYSHSSSGWIRRWKGGSSSVTLRRKRGGRVTGYSGARTCRPEPLRKCERPGTPGSGDRSLQEGHKEQDPHAQLGSQGHRPHPATRAAGGSDADVAPARRGSPAWGPAPPSELLRDRLSAGPPGSRKFRAHLLCSE